MKNTFCLEENAKNISIMRINDIFKVCVKDIDLGITYFLEEKCDAAVPQEVLAFGSISLADFINKQLPKDVRSLKQLETDNLYAEAKLNATTLMISGKVIIESKYALREELLAFESLLNKHEKYLLATVDKTIEIHNEAIADAYTGSNLSR